MNAPVRREDSVVKILKSVRDRIDPLEEAASAIVRRRRAERDRVRESIESATLVFCKEEHELSSALREACKKSKHAETQ